MNCDAIAPYYAAMEFAVFGRALERCRFHFLPELRDARRALVLGDGDGRFLKRLLDACPQLHADYVDCSGEMLERARRRAGSQRVDYFCADALRQLPGSGYDLVVSHFFLDCFDAKGLEAIVARVGEAAPKARWLISEFRVPANRWIATPSRALIATMYWFFSFATGLTARALVDHRPLLRAGGFRLGADAAHARGLMVSELWVREAVE
jgi:ubiquinone/menaquinone biosynthesis C-methylase UbiE